MHCTSNILTSNKVLFLFEHFYASTLLFVQKIRLIVASIKRTFKKHLIISNISFYIPISYPHKCIIEVSQRCLLINGNLSHKTQVK